MTAADHVATFEAAGLAAVRAHLVAEHALACRERFGLSPLDVGAWHRDREAGVHRHLHQPAEPIGPDLSDWFDLAVASPRVQAKAARLAVIREPQLDTRVLRAGAVLGDSGRWYRCWVNVATWRGACSRGGDHDAQPDAQPCSHPLALAAHLCLHDPELARLADLDGAA